MTSVRVPPDVVHAMEVHGANEEPAEACGLVAGIDDRVRFFYPLTNVAASSSEFVVDPIGHGRALRHAEASGWSLIGVFHTHPRGSAIPSERDRAELFDPDWIQFVGGPAGIRAWRQVGEQLVEVTLDPGSATTTLRRHAH